MYRNSIYWIDLNRFDQKPDKSTWLEVSQALIERGYNVTLLTGYKKVKYEPVGYDIKIKYFNTIGFAGLFRYSLIIAITYWVIRNVEKNDIVILSPGALYMTTFMNLFNKNNLHLDIRTVPVNIHTLRDKVDRILFWKLPMKYMVNNVKGFSFITERLKDSVQEEFNLKITDYVIWQSGANVKMFRPLIENKQENKHKFVLFYHGSVTLNRGLDKVIEAIAHLDKILLKNFYFLIVGSGKGLFELKKQVKEMMVEDHIEFTGYLPYEDIPKYISQADCCICPLPDYPEWQVSSPIKVFEYMASAKPIILTPISPHLDIIQDEQFVIWAKDDSAVAIKTAIESAIIKIDGLKIAARTAPNIINKKYTWDKQGEKLCSYLRKMFV